jgi:RNA polymerase sigma factor (sigma-70 family)
MTTTPSPWKARNRALLAAYARERSIRCRNAVVQANLPLVWQAARREQQRSGQCFEDLCQVGCIGLIRAVEAFDHNRNVSLSSAALPWIVGAMRHHLRDRCQPLRGSRSLRELSARARSLQQQRQQEQRPALSTAELVAALGCTGERWREAQGLELALRQASLEQPQLQADGSALSLAEVLIDPRSLDPYGRAIRWQHRRLLRRVLLGLERQQRRLLLGRVLQGKAWADLGPPLGWSARVAQRRCQALLEGLRRQLLDNGLADLEAAG